MTAKERGAIHSLREDLQRQFGATRVVLFGSAARGAMDVESDIDLFVQVPELDWNRESAMIGLAFETSLEIGRCVSLSVFSDRELAEEPSCAAGLLQRVEREGKPV